MQTISDTYVIVNKSAGGCSDNGYVYDNVDEANRHLSIINKELLVLGFEPYEVMRLSDYLNERYKDGEHRGASFVNHFDSW